MTPEPVNARRCFRHRLAWCGLALALVVPLTGCVYLRLLAFQGQLAEFDRYVEVIDTGDLALSFRKPVLSAADIHWLIKLKPTSTSASTEDQQQTWVWTFVKQRAAGSRETGAFDLSFATAFASNKMSRFVISERFFAFMPKPMVLGLARSFGRADIDRKKRAAHVRWQGPGAEKITFPTWREMERLLGEPLETREQADQSIRLYQYTLDTPTPAAPEKKAAWARFHFRRDSGVLTRIEADFAGFKVNVALDPPAVRQGEE